MPLLSGWQRPLVQSLKFRYLVIPPILLSILTAVVLFVYSDPNVALLYSQCHAHARLPGLSRVPLIGTPACFLVSFFQHAVAAKRAASVMSVVLSFVSGLLTVYTVEGARVCNRPNVLIAYPTGPLLVFNLVGGAMVWQLLITPAFFHRARRILTEREKRRQAAEESQEGGGETEHDVLDPNFGKDMRHLGNASERIAIPIGVLLGFVAPSLGMLVKGSPASVGVWLFSPIYVSLIRKAVRVLLRLTRSQLRSLHLESNKVSLAMVYGAPVLCSVLSQAVLLWNVIARKDDRQEMTRSTMRFVEVDITFVGLTVLYWLFVEVGWRTVGVMLLSSLVLGPGAGVCAGWIYRERWWFKALEGVRREAEEASGQVDEETPLLDGA
jgi:hypothetical protein